MLFVSPTACARGGRALQQTTLHCPLICYAYIVADRQNFDQTEFCVLLAAVAISALRI